MSIYLVVAIILVLIFITLLVGNTKKEERLFVFALVLILSICSICLGGMIESIRVKSFKLNNTEIINKDTNINKEITIKSLKDTLIIIQK